MAQHHLLLGSIEGRGRRRVTPVAATAGLVSTEADRSSLWCAMLSKRSGGLIMDGTLEAKMPELVDGGQVCVGRFASRRRPLL